MMVLKGWIEAAASERLRFEEGSKQNIVLTYTTSEWPSQPRSLLWLSLSRYWECWTAISTNHQLPSILRYETTWTMSVDFTQFSL